MPTTNERGIDLLDTYAGPYLTRLMEAMSQGIPRSEVPKCGDTWRSPLDKDEEDWSCDRDPQHAGLHAAMALAKTEESPGIVVVVCAIWSDEEALVR